MSKIISRMLVLGLLVSFVQAQQPPRDIDKDAHKATKDVKSGAKNQNKAQDKDNKATGDHDFESMQGARIGGDAPDGGPVIPSKVGLNHDVRSEAKNQNKAPEQDNKGAGGREHRGRLQDIEEDAQSSVGADTRVSSDKKGAKGVTKGSPNMAPSARVSGDRQLAGTQNTSASASGKKARKGALGRFFSRLTGGGGEKVDGGKTGAVQRAGDGQDQPSSGQGQQPKGDKGAPAPKPQGPDDGGGR